MKTSFRRLLVASISFNKNKQKDFVIYLLSGYILVHNVLVKYIQVCIND